jgi:hypothetical protein
VQLAHETLKGSFMNGRIETLVALCKVWGLVKFFHPYLAYRKIDWDEALLTTLSEIERAGDAVSLGDGIPTMLLSLGDPATRVVSVTSPDSGFVSSRHPASRALDAKTLLVEMTNYADFADWVDVRERACAVAEQIGNYETVIFDLRKKVVCPLGFKPNFAFLSAIGPAPCLSA